MVNEQSCFLWVENEMRIGSLLPLLVKDLLEFKPDSFYFRETSKCTKLLTGKRQRKIMKRLRHAAREKNEEGNLRGFGVGVG